ncbi:hypothetical protein TGP89_278130 [Toxoplasma gondii p89]|uniref:Uncharacterized protein n=1 Tax=Toxoplasma gondii p89 TaxID=943119 RepID=A0A086JJ46_TOXGO|nr:hypothetical protein TGP89_278130 [Toxoplasma gondii p89]
MDDSINVSGPTGTSNHMSSEDLPNENEPPATSQPGTSSLAQLQTLTSALTPDNSSSSPSRRMSTPLPETLQSSDVDPISDSAHDTGRSEISKSSSECSSRSSNKVGEMLLNDIENVATDEKCAEADATLGSSQLEDQRSPRDGDALAATENTVQPQSGCAPLSSNNGSSSPTQRKYTGLAEEFQPSDDDPIQESAHARDRTEPSRVSSEGSSGSSDKGGEMLLNDVDNAAPEGKCSETDDVMHSTSALCPCLLQDRNISSPSNSSLMCIGNENTLVDGNATEAVVQQPTSQGFGLLPDGAGMTSELQSLDKGAQIDEIGNQEASVVNEGHADEPESGKSPSVESGQPNADAEPAMGDLESNPSLESSSSPLKIENGGSATKVPVPVSAGDQDGYEYLSMKEKLQMFEEISKQRSSELLKSFSSVSSRRGDFASRSSIRTDVSPRICDPPSETAVRERDEQIAKLSGLLKHRMDTLGAVGSELEKKEKTLEMIREENAYLTREFMGRVAATGQEQPLPTLPSLPRSDVATSWLAQEARNEEARHDAAIRSSMVSCGPRTLPVSAEAPDSPAPPETLDQPEASSSAESSKQASRQASSISSGNRSFSSRNESPMSIKQSRGDSVERKQLRTRQRAQDDTAVVCPPLQEKLKLFEDLQSKEKMEDRQKSTRIATGGGLAKSTQEQPPLERDTAARPKDSLGGATQHPFLAEKDAEIARLIALVRHKESLIDLAQQGVAQKEEEILAELAEKFSLSRDYMHYLAEHHEKAPEILRTGKSFCPRSSAGNREMTADGETETGTRLVNRSRGKTDTGCTERDQPGAHTTSTTNSMAQDERGISDSMLEFRPAKLNAYALHMDQRPTRNQGPRRSEDARKRSPEESREVAPLRRLDNLEEWLSEEFSSQDELCTKGAGKERLELEGCEDIFAGGVCRIEETRKDNYSKYPVENDKSKFSCNILRERKVGDDSVESETLSSPWIASASAETYDGDELRAEEEIALEALRQYTRRVAPIRENAVMVPDANGDFTTYEGGAGFAEGRLADSRTEGYSKLMAGVDHDEELFTDALTSPSGHAETGQLQRACNARECFEAKSNATKMELIQCSGASLRGSPRTLEETEDGMASNGRRRQQAIESVPRQFAQGRTRSVRRCDEEPSDRVWPSLPSFSHAWRQGIDTLDSDEDDSYGDKTGPYFHGICTSVKLSPKGNIPYGGSDRTTTRHTAQAIRQCRDTSDGQIKSNGKKLRAELFFKTLMDQTRARLERHLAEEEFSGLRDSSGLRRAMKAYEDVKQMAMEVRDMRKENQLLRQAVFNSRRKMETIVGGLEEMSQDERTLRTALSWFITNDLQLGVPSHEQHLSSAALDSNDFQTQAASSKQALSDSPPQLMGTENDRPVSHDLSPAEALDDKRVEDVSSEIPLKSPNDVSKSNEGFSNSVIKRPNPEAIQPTQNTEQTARSLKRATRLVKIQEKRIAALEEQLFELTKRCMYLEELDDAMWGLIEERMENDTRITERIKETYERSCAQLRARLADAGAAEVIDK